MRTLAALLSCFVLVWISFQYVDRPASTWSHEHLGRPGFLNEFSQFADPLPIAAAIGAAFAAGAAAFGNWKSGERGRTFISACLAILVSEEIKDQLKTLFGRPWPESWTSRNPSWIGSHAYGFHFLHGGSGWESFPSGHMAQAAALASVVWLRLPRIRWLGVALASLVAVALWGANYHFVADIIAGAFMGAACGICVVGVVCRKQTHKTEALLRGPTRARNALPNSSNGWRR